MNNPTSVHRCTGKLSAGTFKEVSGSGRGRFTARGGGFLVIAGCLFLSTVAPAPAADAELVRATIVGALTPGETGKIAVRWFGGDEEAQLDIWIDFDGDGTWSDDELVVSRHPLVEQLVVLEFWTPGTAVFDCRTRARFRVVGSNGILWERAQIVSSYGRSQGCDWSLEFALSDLDGGEVRAFAVFDDGGGEALYVGGDFLSAGAELAHGIARWDGNGWTTLTGPQGTGTDGPVQVLAVYDDGGGPALFVGGEFSTAGGVAVNHLATWDGSQWSAVSDPGFDGPVRALEVLDLGGGDELFVGGDFKFVDGIRVNSITSWDGSSWRTFSAPGGIGVNAGLSNGTVLALAVFDDGGGDALIAAGGFIKAGGTWTNSIAKWNGSEWSGLGDGLCNGGVYDLVVYDDGSGPALFAGGSFLNICSDGSSFSVARWDGAAWSALTTQATSLNRYVFSLSVQDFGSGPRLYAGGSFTGTRDENTVLERVAAFDGSSWSAVPGGVDDDVWALLAHDHGNGAQLYAGGAFVHAGDSRAGRVATWDGSSWAPFSEYAGNGLAAEVEAFVVYDDGTGPGLYVAGGFEDAGDEVVSYVARWDGAAWSALQGPAGTGTDGVPQALAVYDDGGGAALFVGGEFTTAGGVVVNNIGKWDGSAWTALSGPSGTGTDGTVHTLVVYDDGNGDALYVGGTFSGAGGVPCEHVARWDGTDWSELVGPSGNGTDGPVLASAVFDDGGGELLFVGGDFLTAGGVNARRVAAWDGTAWYAPYGPIASGASDTVRALAVFDDGGGEALVAGGDFLQAGGVDVYGIAAWDGFAWSALFGPYGPGTNGSVKSLAAASHGQGESLFLGGDFTIAGGVTVNGISRWDGLEFSSLPGSSDVGVGPAGSVGALTAYDDGAGNALFAGGEFLIAGGLPSAMIGRWACDSETIFVDGFESGDTGEWSWTTP